MILGLVLILIIFSSVSYLRFCFKVSKYFLTRSIWYSNQNIASFSEPRASHEQTSSHHRFYNSQYLPSAPSGGSRGLGGSSPPVQKHPKTCKSYSRFIALSPLPPLWLEGGGGKPKSWIRHCLLLFYVNNRGRRSIDLLSYLLQGRYKLFVSTLIASQVH